jgi:glucokinase
MRKWIGIDVGGTTIKGAAVLEDGTIVAKGELPTDAERGVAVVLDTIANWAREMAEKAEWDWADVSGVGIGLPAFLDFETGVVETAVNLGKDWSNIPVVKELGERLNHKPIMIENDANAAALGESWAGGGKGYRDALCITLGTGVGGGIVIGHQLVHGSNGMAGEIGHITIDPAGRMCNCGRRGCLETIASATGIVAEATERIASGASSSLSAHPRLNTRMIFEHARQGDALARAVVERTTDRLGFALANIGATINPQVIVVGGGVSHAGEELLHPLREAYARYALPRVLAGTTIHLAELGNDAGVIGAALLMASQERE